MLNEAYFLLPVEGRLLAKYRDRCKVSGKKVVCQARHGTVNLWKCPLALRWTAVGLPKRDVMPQFDLGYASLYTLQTVGGGKSTHIFQECMSIDCNRFTTIIINI